jgi:hypothetical protein
MDLTIDEREYRVKKLDAIKQFHISRRLLPILSTLGISLETIEQAAKTEAKTMAAFMPALEPVSKVLAAMSDEDANYIIFTCLSVVSRNEGEGRFASVSTGNRMMFEDIDMPIMIRLVVEVLKENLMGFFAGLGASKS